MGYVQGRDIKEIIEKSVENVVTLLEEENNLTLQRRERELTEQIIINLSKDTDRKSEKNKFISELNSIEDHVKSIYNNNRVPIKYEIQLIKKIQNLKLQLEMIGF